MLTKVLPYIHKFIELLVRANIELNAVVLYGSFADNTASPVSDIDLKIFVLDKNYEARILNIEGEVNKEISKDGLQFYIKSMVSVNKDSEHIEDGILLWGSPIRVHAGKKGLVRKKIITYNTEKLGQIQRAELVRRLFGYKTKKKSKVYSFDGSVKRLNAKRLRNAILIDKQSAKQIENILKEYDLEFQSSEVFLPEYARFVEK
jgi:predicted nucleotidyltransferase